MTQKTKNILVTGGCGFIGSCFVIKQIFNGHNVVNLDSLTYASNPNNLREVAENKNYHFVRGDICDSALVAKLLQEFAIDWVVNFAAESHVDNSISSPDAFIRTNINGVYSLLKSCLEYWKSLAADKKENFRFLQISTDEVYGSLSPQDKKFDEETRYDPSSPYSSSKAAADHLVAAWHKTYGLPTLITNCSNNFGPRQHEEKLIPTIIRSCLSGKEIPIYGNGKNIRDWIYVEDHCHGVELALTLASPGSTYCFGGNCEKENIEIAKLICDVLDQKYPKKDGTSYNKQIIFVTDRLGHDFRYAISNDKAERDLKFSLSKNFSTRIEETILQYLKNFSQSTH